MLRKLFAYSLLERGRIILQIILDKNDRPLIKNKNIYLHNIFNSLAQGNSQKEVCSEFSLTQKDLLGVFNYVQDVMQNKPGAMSQKIVAYIDGASKGNPGDAGIGIVFYNKKGDIIKEVKEYIGIATNNIAEYKALIRALEVICEEFANDELKIFTDSELVAKQVSGHYRVKDKFLKELFTQVQRLLKNLKKIEVIHIKRNKNKHADKLANVAINLK